MLRDLLDADELALVRPSPPPKGSDAMRAKLTDDRFSDPEWIFERKLDGIRCVAVRDGGPVRLWSRNDLSLDGRYPELAEALGAEAAPRFAIDGEVVAFEGGQTSFARLTQRGRPLRRGLPLRLRRALARRLRPPRAAAARPQAAPAPRVRLPRPRAADAAPQRRRRGVLRRGVPARLGGPDRQARRQHLLVAALGRLAEVQVRARAGARRRRLHRAARLAHALRRAAARRLRRRRRAALRGQGRHRVRPRRARLDSATSSRRCGASSSPFADADAIRERDVTWVRPELVAQVGFTEWTRDGRLRHPRFQGLRDDKAARDVVREG